jgi:hypothetical protein
MQIWIHAWLMLRTLSLKKPRKKKKKKKEKGNLTPRRYTFFSYRLRCLKSGNGPYPSNFMTFVMFPTLYNFWLIPNSFKIYL